MRLSRYFLPTLKEPPNDAEIISHQLMLRAGMIRKLASGLYTWLPLGFRVLKRVEQIVREEMNRAGAFELLMPAVQPAELWQETQRWDKFGPQLLKIKDRHERNFCYGPTHEEVITDLMRHGLQSYKQLPLNVYQIQTKFRDEIRPRFGVMRAREFIMKDAYSFHLSHESLAETYQIMYETYTRIFQRLGLKFRAVLADNGSIGGEASHEFHVLAESGEDEIFYSDSSNYAANVELAVAINSPTTSTITNEVLQPIQNVFTPGIKSVEEISRTLNQPITSIVKTLIVHGKETPFAAILLRGDHELNPVKAEKHPLIASPCKLASAKDIEMLVNCEAGYVGPCNLEIPVIADHAVVELRNFICGANQTDYHLINVNWSRDLPLPNEIADLRKVKVGDLSPDGEGTLKMARGIEVGHIFQLGDNYSKAMQATVLDQLGKPTILQMGCYGIGVSRIVAAAIEQNNDEHGIIWPDAMAPFHIALLPVNMHKSQRVFAACEKLYNELMNAGYDVLWDERNERLGVMFADIELIGIPHQLIISERNLDNGMIEYKSRREGEKLLLPQAELIEFLAKRIKS